MNKHLSLILPNLLDKASGHDLSEQEARSVEFAAATSASTDLVALEWLLTMAARQSLDTPDMDPLLYLWQQAGQQGPVPIAALSYYNDFGVLPDGPVLRADPVHLEADRDCVRLLRANLPDLDDDAARQLIVEINAQFGDEPWQLVMGTAQRWYLLLDDEANINTTDPDKLLGADIHDFLPTGEKSRYWRGIVNEIQMLMFSSAINQHLQEAALTPVTSLWLWGESKEGSMSASLAAPWAGFYADHPVAVSIGRLSGITVLPPPSTGIALLDLLPNAGKVVCWPSLSGGHSGRVSFNHGWALPLYKALQRRLFQSSMAQQVDSLEMLTFNGFSYISLAGKRRWWRHKRIESFMG